MTTTQAAKILIRQEAKNMGIKTPKFNRTNLLNLIGDLLDATHKWIHVQTDESRALH